MKIVTGEIKLTEIVNQELDPDPNPFFPDADPDLNQPMRIQGSGSACS